MWDISAKIMNNISVVIISESLLKLWDEIEGNIELRIHFADSDIAYK